MGNFGAGPYAQTPDCTGLVVTPHSDNGAGTLLVEPIPCEVHTRPPLPAVSHSGGKKSIKKIPADLQLKVFSVLSDVFWEFCKCIHPSAMCHLHSLCLFSLRISTSLNCFLCSPWHFCKVSSPQLSILLVQPVHLWKFPMEMTINMYQFL